MTARWIFVALLAATSLEARSSAQVLVLPAMQDNTLYEDGQGGLSNGSGDFFFSGTTATGLTRRALLVFDLSGVPPGAVIRDVRLTLAMKQTMGGAEDVSLHKVGRAWGEGASNAGGHEGGGAPATACDATWLHAEFPGGTCAGTLWSTPGGDYEAAPSATQSVAFEGFYDWSGPGLVADVEAWIAAPAENFGWLLKHDEEAGLLTAKRFAARESGVVLDRPILTVTYQAPACDVESYCVGASSSLGVGASMSWAGSCSVASNDFVLRAAPVPNQTFLFITGTSAAQGTFGNGILCIGGSLERINPPGFASGNSAERRVDLVALGIAAGSTHRFQCWFRDPLAGGAGFNASDGLRVTFGN